VNESMASFFSERTAEYLLVWQLKACLEIGSRTVIPIFFWKTREGNRTSSKLHAGATVRIVALFARRPKITDKANLVAGKLNAELFRFTEVASSFGIYTIAGFPAVGRIFDLYLNPSTIWLSLDYPENSGDIEFFVDISRENKKAFNDDLGLLHMLSSSTIVHESDKVCRAYSWGDAMNVLGMLQREINSYYNFPFGGGYKPVFLLIIDKE